MRRLIVLLPLLAACTSSPPPRAPSRAPAAAAPVTWSETQAPQPAAPASVPPSQPSQPSQPGPAPAADAPQRQFVSYTFKVAGLTCPIRCAQEVKEMLRKVPGVLDVFVDTDKREARVNAEPGTDPETILAGLKHPYSGRLK